MPSSLLVEGTNVIAVEIHQASAGNSDISFDGTLAGTRATETDSPIALNRSTTLCARSRNNGEWSALTEATFYVGTPASAANLVISEINYHPAPPTEAEAQQPFVTDDSDFEFIGITNISSKDLELIGAGFAEQVINDHLEGVRYTFEQGRVISPGQRLVVVANQAAFLARYYGTPASAIAGEFDGNLGNSGEWLQLRNAEGTIIASFRYNDVDPWPLAADGDGPSLVRNSPGTKPDPSLAARPLTERSEILLGLRPYPKDGR